jgi:hypothetical protein
MNKQAPEYERARTEAVERTKNILNLPSDEYSLVQSANRIVDRILSLVEIRADDQSLPNAARLEAELKKQGNYHTARTMAYAFSQQDMLEAGFVKVVKEV